MRVLIVTGDNRPLLPADDCSSLGYWVYAALINAHYAARHGYDFRYVRYASAARPAVSSTPRPHPWSKVAAVWDGLERGYDVVVWMDSDAIFASIDAPPVQRILESAPAVAGTAPPATASVVAVSNKPWTDCVACSGIMVFRNDATARRVLKAMWADERAATWEHPYEQLAFNALLGSDAGSSIGVLDVRLFVLVEMPARDQTFAHVPHGINNRKQVLQLLYERFTVLGDPLQGVARLHGQGQVVDAHPSEMLASMVAGAVTDA